MHRTSYISVFACTLGLLFVLSSAGFAQRLATAEDLDSKYACGGGGRYAAETGIQWYREWDGCYVKYPSRSGTTNKMWTVGKMDYRPTAIRGGPANENIAMPYPGTYQPNETIISDIFAGEAPHISDTINYSVSHRGNVWSIANEPNWSPLFTPTDYAREFQLYSTYIKGLDPTAKIATGGILVSNGYTGPNHLGIKWWDWIDQFRSEYHRLYGVEPPVDVWDIHPYDLADNAGGTTPGQKAISNIVAMREYLDNAGLTEVPITLSEVACLAAPTDQVQVDFINELFSWLNVNSDAYKVDRWFWWGSTTAAFGPTGLFDGSYNRNFINVKGDAYMRQMGRIFVDPYWVGDQTRIKGSMRNPYGSIAEVMAAFATGQGDVRQGDIIYDFSTGQNWVVPEAPSLAVMCLLGTGFLRDWMLRQRK